MTAVDHAELGSDLGYWEMEAGRLHEGRKLASEFSEVEWGFLKRALTQSLALLSEIEGLKAERERVAGNSLWWEKVIGGTHEPSGEVRSIKHLHPAMVKPIYEAHKGTAVADVIAGLIFSLAITENREQFLVADALERAAEAERQLADLRTQAPDSWRPIETAPKDGSRILLSGMPYGPKVDVGAWGSTTYNRSAKAYNRGWTTRPGNETNPTHWMPLPAAPALRPQTAESGE